MPRPAKPPHLVWIKPKYQPGPEKKLKSRGYWAIKHGPKLVSTGLGYELRADAEIKRHEYEAALYAQTPIADHGKDVREVLIVDLIRFYIERHQKKIAQKSKERKRDYLNSVERLITFWAGKTVYDINERNCAAYQQKARPGKPLADNTARRELQDLKAMVLFGVKKGLCELKGHIIDWELPSAPEPRMTYYSHAEVARLVRYAYRAKNDAMGSKGHKTSKHLARFILIAVHTGTRAEKIEQASFENVDGRPWMDVENGIFYRAGVGNKTPLNKRADPVRIPDRLLHQLRRWKEEGATNVIEHNGKPGSTRRAFYTLKFKVFAENRAREVNRHTFKHTCASWLMEKRVALDIIASYLSTTEEVIKAVYGHFSPDFHIEVNDAQKADREKRAAEAKRIKSQAAKAA
ncbi:hypothetical protein [Rhizobium sp. SYY.PMSO]|uniref:hypothetical protein n=1 Tax=Rhizobium sp. SYY.PMSO TaxID=3382192 RepID=UPI00398FE7B1